MIDKEAEILGRKVKADHVMEQAAADLKEILKATIRDLDPFPPLFDSPFIKGVEAEPGAAARADIGCVVVCPDGELYEFTYTLGAAGPMPDFSRKEETKKLDLPPRDYIPYAYNAIAEVTRLIMERRRQPRPKA
jgi:hypothetical protein